MNLVSIVLAAGSSTRFGGDKLSAIFRGEPLIRHAIRAARAAPVERVLVVCSQELDTGEWDGRPPVSAVRVDSNALSSSLKAGIAEAGEADGVLIFLGDMPLVPPGIADRLAKILDGNLAAMPQFDGKPGHPVLLSARLFPEIAELKGDEGAGRLLRSREDVARLDIEEPGILLDVDRAEDLARLEERGGQRR